MMDGIRSTTRAGARLGILGLFVMLAAPRAHAVASFARQTNLPCSSCHTTIPELTPLGRLFKLNGYTMTGISQITSDSGPTKAGLNINTWLPLSAFVQVSNTWTTKPQPQSQNGNFELPQAASLFLAGAMSTHIGGFVQVTYSTQDDHFSWDNTDIRYANRTKAAGKELIYGVTFNNNPTVEDLWHSTPAWGFPWVSNDLAPTPAAGTLIDGGLAQDVAGIGGYAMWDNHLYGAAAIYRSEHIGGPQPNPGVDSAGSPFGINIRGVAPYWRLAWQQSKGNNYLEVGTFGIHVASTPGAVVGPQDFFTDIAADFQYERVFPTLGNDLLAVHGTYIHENSDLIAMTAAGGAGFPAHHLNTARADAVFHFGNKYAATFGVFGTTGTTDPTLFPAGAVSGSASGDPHSRGYIANASYWPVQNIQLALQYTGYQKFNGGSTNYDGSGRNAFDNNSLYMLVWFVF
ncbi:MAG TPA: cytochrome C [Terriglobia bacterium]|nr:cytochrome C [Terriglobia bacterium]